ncbi:UNVERIFIED_ORG: hypothetical protein E4P37_17790 [Bacillus sp. AZ43]
MNEHELRDLLQSAAGRGGVALLDDDAAVDAVVHTHRTRRRRRAAVIAVAACVALVAVAVPLLWPTARPVPDPVEVAHAPAPALDWPVRGSLADDPAALEEVRDLDWSEPLWTPEVEQRRVAFLGDVPGSRRALVVGRTDVSGAVTGQWFTGARGEDPGALVPDGPVERLEERESASHLGADGVMVVLVAPGDAVELTPRVEVAADGSVSRPATPVDTANGLAVATIGRPAIEGSAGSYRVVRGGSVVESRPAGAYFPMGGAWDPPVLTPRDPSSEPPVPEAVDIAVSSVLAQTGLTRDEVRLDLLFSGPFPQGTGEGDPQAVVVAVTMPTGAVVVSIAWADIEPSGAGSLGTCGMQAHPAGTSLDELAVAATCTFATGQVQPEPALLVYAAGEVAAITVRDAQGRAVAEAYAGPTGLMSVTPAPRDGAVRVEPFSGEAREFAVIGSRQDEIVDRAGRTADG